MNDEFTPSSDGWHDEGQVESYVRRVEHLAPRLAAEELLAELLPGTPVRVLDLGAGDGRLTALVMAHRPTVGRAVLIDNSEPMLDRARDRFALDDRVQVLHHDVASQLPALGTFDLVVSGFALHHLEHGRKRSLFAEVFALLQPGALFANLDVIASATPALHAEFLAAIQRTADDPEDRLAPIDDQLGWMRSAGFENVDCQWRWRGFALMVGSRPPL